MFFLAFHCQALLSQSVVPLFSFDGNSTLSEEQMRYKSKIESENVSNPILEVRVNNLYSVVENGQVHVELPNILCDLSYKVKNSIHTSSEEYTWYGELELSENSSCDCSDGYFSYHYDHGDISVKLNVGDSTYHISPLGQGKHVFYKNAQNSTLEENCAVHEISTEYQIPSHQGEVAERDGSCTVKLLVLYTPDGASNSPVPITTSINNQISDLRLALSNSQLSQWVQIEVVGVLPYSQSQIGTDSKRIVEDYIRDLAITGSEINQLAANTKADIVVVVQGQDLLGCYGVSGTLNYAPGRFVAVTESFGDALRYFSFAHEVAHLLGAKHHQDNSAPAWARAKNIKGTIDCKKVNKTTLVYGGAQHSRILYISNPEVRYNSIPTGDGDRNNAERMRSNVCLVASENPEDLGSPNGKLFTRMTRLPTHHCPCSGVSLASSTFGGPMGSIYTYDWQYSTDGINFVSFSTDQAVWFGFPCEVGQTIFVKVIVTATVFNPITQQTFVEKAVSSDRFITSYVSDSGVSLNCDRSTSQTSEEKFYLSPNPSNDFLNLEFPNDFKGTSFIEIFNMQGKIVQRFQTDTVLKKISISDLPSGAYLLNIRQDAISHTSKFIKK
jgi:Secretion system C-terminal sorting domain/Metallo-peptidase family M12B Reprolysin-like